MDFHLLQPFTIDEAEIYTNYFEKSRTRLADACPNSRIAWNLGYSYRYLIIEDCFCLISDGGVFTKPHFSLPIGNLSTEKLENILMEIEAIFKKEDWLLRGMFIDESYLKTFNHLSNYDLTWSVDSDFSDYVYKSSKLAKLKGKKYRAKRNHINKFIRDYPDFEYRSLEKSDQKNALKLVKSWCIDKGIDCDNLNESDYLAINNLFEYWDELNVYGGVIYLNNDLIAFSMGSIIHDGKEAVIHFEKADPTYEGLYALINQLTIISEFKGAKLVNREEDMGDAGLRLAKESYIPSEKLKKFEVILTSL